MAGRMSRVWNGRMPGFDNELIVGHENARDVADWLIFNFVLAALNVYKRAIGNLSARRFKVPGTLQLLLHPQARGHQYYESVQNGGPSRMTSASRTRFPAKPNRRCQVRFSSRGGWLELSRWRPRMDLAERRLRFPLFRTIPWTPTRAEDKEKKIFIYNDDDGADVEYEAEKQLPDQTQRGRPETPTQTTGCD